MNAPPMITTHSRDKEEKNLQMKALAFKVTSSHLSLNDFQVLIDFEEKLNIIFVFEVSFTELHGHSVLFHRLIFYLKRFAFGNASYQTE